MNTTIDSKYITISTKVSIAIFLDYQQETESTRNHLVLPTPKHLSQPPFVNIIYSNTHHLSEQEEDLDDGLLLTTLDGRLYYLSEMNHHAAAMGSDSYNSLYTGYQIKLGLNEQVLCVTTFNLSRKYHAMIGTSIGNIYLVRLRDDDNSIAISGKVLYADQTQSSLLKSMWSYFPITNHTENEIEKGNIIKITEGHTKDEIIVLNANYIQRWVFDSTGELIISAALHLTPIIEKKTAQTLLPSYIKSNVTIHIIDIEKYRTTEWIILYSYSVPEMGDYSQFALLLLQDQHEAGYVIKDVFSLPYSTMLKTKKRNATLQVANGPIVYVTFDDSVIAISVTRNSFFEHPLVLKKTKENNRVIGTIVKRNTLSNVENENVTAALVFTTASDVLEFRINNNHILESSANGNIYAIDYENDDKRIMDQLRSQLEQAVYFGIIEQNPLYFPLRVEGHNKIGSVALTLAHHIVSGDASLTSTKLDQKLLLKRKLKFITQIIHLINIENLLDSVDTNTYVSLLKIVEACHLGLEVLDYCNEWIENHNNDETALFINYLLDTMKNIMNMDDQHSFKDYLTNLTSNHILDVPTWIEKMEVYESELTGTGILDKSYLLSTVSDFVMKIVTSIQSIEQGFIYNQEMAFPVDGLSFSFSQVLRRFFNNIKLCLDNLDQHRSSQLYETLCNQLSHMGTLLLDIYSEISKSKTKTNNGDKDMYKQESSQIIHVFWELKLQEKAIVLSKQYHHMPTLVLYTQSLSGEAQKLAINDFIQEYGDEFKYDLLCYYISNECEEDVLAFDQLPEKVIIEAVKNNPKVAWKYHLKLGQFSKTYNYLELVLSHTEDIHTKKTLLSQAKLAYVASQTEEITPLPLSMILESPNMKNLTVSLELIENEEIILNKFNEMLTGQTFGNLSEKVDYIINKAATNLLEGQFDYELMALSKLIAQLLNGKVLDYQEFITLLCYMDNNGHNIENYILALYIVSKAIPNNDINQIKMTLSLIWKFVYLKDNWLHIHQCIQNSNDLQLSNVLRQTILYRILLMCKLQGVSNDLILRPSEVQLDNNNNLDNILTQNGLHHNLDLYFNEALNVISTI
ncbi:unnamed protein product [Cunninghamella echinulata]